MTRGSTINRDAISKLSQALAILRASGFESLLEAAVYFAIAEAELAGTYLDISSGATLVGAPISTFSRIAWNLHERGLIHYEPDGKDRRRKVLRANLGRAAVGQPALANA